jgi:Mn-dependent DtxR family transcriptional regulator
VVKFTKLQGQYLAFIDEYTKVHRTPPAEEDIRKYFRVTPPSVHQMILTLEKHGLVSRVPGKSRSVSVLVPRAELPRLE